jgi:hypothetical protein
MRGLAAGLMVTLAIGGLWSARPLAHKPITSPYTFTEHVLPILREHCQACHVEGGVAPMALETHAQTVPWAESIRLELISGHMPPWPVDAPRGRFRHARTVSAREVDVVLTWASGGTPPGGPEPPPSPRAPAAWPLGTPDQTIVLPVRTLPAGTNDDIADVQVPVVSPTPRWLSAVDVKPGTPAMVRGVTVTVQDETGAGAQQPGTLAPEPVAVSWVPGDAPVPLPAGIGVRLPARATLTVRVRYKKTWQYEREAMTDATSLGLYFTTSAAAPLMGMTLAPPGAHGSAGTTALTSRLRVLAISTAPGTPDAGAVVEVRRPDGAQDALMTLRSDQGWARRYWFEQPVSLPAGSVLTVRPLTVLAPSLLTPLAPMALLPASVGTGSATATPGITGPHIRLHVVPD